MNKLEAFKLGSSIVVAVGTMKIVGDTTAPFVLKRNLVEKVAVSSAQIVIGLLVADTASNFIDKQTDNVIAWLDKSAKKNAEVE